MVARLCLVLSLVASAALAQPDPPLSAERLQQLRAAYVDPAKLDIPSLLAGLKSSEAAVRDRAANEVCRLLDRAQADDPRGPKEIDWDDAWGHYWTAPDETPPGAIRRFILEALSEGEFGDAAVPVFRWFVLREWSASQWGRSRWLVEMLRKNRGPAWDALVIEAATNPADTSPVNLEAMQLVVKRRLPIGQGELRQLAQHYRRPVADLARRLAKILGRPDPGAYDPAAAVASPAFAALMQRARRCIPWLPGADAKYVVVTWRDDENDDTLIWHGWQVQRDDRSVTIATPDGARYRLPFRDGSYRASVETRTLDDVVAWLGRERARVRSGGRSPLFSEHDGFRPEAYEYVLARWLYEHGRTALVAKLLLPALNSPVRDVDFIPVQILRRRLGQNYGREMLTAFAAERDPARTESLARGILRALPGTRHAAIARRLLPELSRHRDDFRSLQLPTPAGWKEQKAALSRAEAIRYLAARLRLLTHLQYIYKFGGSDDYLDAPQPERVSGVMTVPRDARLVTSGTDRINPYRELAGAEDPETDRRSGGVNLTFADIEILAPFLLDDVHTRAVVIRDRFDWDALVHVRVLLADLINGVAGMPVVDPDHFDRLTEKAQRHEVRWLVDWVRAHREASEAAEAERLLTLLAHGADSGREYVPDVREGMRDVVARLVRLRRKDAAPIILRYLDLPSSDVVDRTNLVDWATTLDPSLALPHIRGLCRHPNEWVRWRGAFLKLRVGDPAKALATIETLLRRAIARPDPKDIQGFPPRRVMGFEVTEGIEPLLSRNTPETRRVARLVVEGDILEGRVLRHYRTRVLTAFAAAGLPDAHRYVLRRLGRLHGKAQQKLAQEFVVNVVKLRVPPDVIPNLPDPTVSIPALTVWLRLQIRRIEAKKK